MATHGIKQLQKLTLSYCEHGGSSRGIRELLSSGDLITFATKHPALIIHAQSNNGHHPYVRGEYISGWDKTISVRNADVELIVKNCNMLNDSSGRKIVKFEKPVITKNVSVQGIWTPSLNLKGEAYEMKEEM